MNKKQGNCDLSISLRNKETYSVSMTLEGLWGRGVCIFSIIIIFFYLAVSGETGFLFYGA